MAPSGTEFIKTVTGLSLTDRETEIRAQILSGNVPDFLRQLRPVTVMKVAGGVTNQATFYVTPDYLAIKRWTVAAGAAFTALTYYGLLAIPARHIFTVTTVLITLLAAGMAAQAAQFLDAAGVINVLGQRLWDSSAWLPQDSIVGRLLHTLIGYTDRPTELELIAYVATLAVMTALTWIAASTRAARAAA
jgi:hypothetical protein